VRKRTGRNRSSLCERARMMTFLTERFLRRALIVIALGGMVLGLLAWGIGRGELANWIWAALLSSLCPPLLRLGRIWRGPLSR
jgi:hypothetical protein